MSGLVILFFVFTTLAVLASAFLLPRYVNNTRASRFGIGLGLVAVAFALWSFAVVTKPERDQLYIWITVGLFVLLAALLFFISAATLELPPQRQQIALMAGAIFAVGLIVVRFFEPSNPHFSENGFFYFGQQAVVKLMTIALLAATIVPAVLAMASDIRKKSELSANAFIAACIAQLIGGVLLLSSNEDDFLFLVGWVMGAAFLLLVLITAGLVDRLSPARGRA